MGAEALSDALLVLPFSCPDRAALSPRNVDRVLPIDTEGRADGGTDYYIDPETAAIFAAAREHPDAPKQRRRTRRGTLTAPRPVTRPGQIWSGAGSISRGLAIPSQDGHS